LVATDRPLATGDRDDRGLARVLLGVENLVGNATPQQQRREPLGLRDTRCADQDRLTQLVALGDVVDHRGELRVFGLIDQVGVVDTLHGTVRGNRNDAELVDLVQLDSLGLRGAGHSGESLVQAEVVLQRDRGKSLAFLLDGHALLGLDRLVHALVETAPWQHPAGELVDDEHLTVADDVLPVAVEQLLGLERVVQVTDQWRVGGFVEVLDSELVLDQGYALLGDRDGPLALFDVVVLVPDQLRREAGELEVPALVLLGRAGNDQWGSRLVDQDGVDLVDDREVVATLHEILEGPRHVVAQIVETELVVGAVGDVGQVGGPPDGRRLIRQDLAH